MNNKRNIQCKYEIQYGTCRKENCEYLHHNRPKIKLKIQEKRNEPSPLKVSQHTDSKTTDNKGIFNEKLKYIKTNENHNKDIENIIHFQKSNYIVSDCDKFYIYNINDKGDESIYESSKIKNLKIHKIIISSDKTKIIYLIEENQTFMIRILAIENKQEFAQITKNKPIDIFESSNFIIVAEEKNIIEIFFFEIEDLKIKKLHELELEEQITYIEEGGEFLFFGHNNGYISAWNTQTKEPYLNLIKKFRLHYDSITKILCDTKDKDRIILITCSLDKTLKVHSLEHGDRICTCVIDFEKEIVDFKSVFNLKKNYYIVSLKDGELLVYDSKFKKQFEIPSRLKSKSPRFVLSMKNEEDDETKGDFLLITEGKAIHKYYWVKKKKKLKIEDDK